ncbi:sulfatase family protein [Echinicola shivajiensis]|uniref:sulfatase family protein n=1 Tax=Echinicola shivajiensis TaxID=1035916 RepID=UPI001BFCC6D1|nr:sulfatase [Echinicola shivajiensis]
MKPPFTFLLFTCLFLFVFESLEAQSVTKQPNIIVVFADDLGYGDLGCFGHPTIKTPYLDQMAQEGMRLTQFYVGANVCTPSRAALMTGRLPIRFGMAGHKRGVLFPDSSTGIPQEELTIAEALKAEGYVTGLIGKWHLGHLPEFMPNNHGFDFYYGIPYSNDMRPNKAKNNNRPPLPLYRNEEVIERGVNQHTLTKRYTQEAIKFIEQNKEQPFFLYYPNNFPHVPLYASEDFEGKSERGIYGDVVTELDWSVGQILKKLKELGLEENTLVVFTSDNGPWLTQKEAGGSAGLLFEGKGSTYEGGMRVPAIAWWPGVIAPGQVSTSLVTSMDLYPTFMHMAGGDVPNDREMDGTDLMPILGGKQKEVREFVYYYFHDKLHAIRKGPWKAHFTTKPSYSSEKPVNHEVPLLYNLEHDPSEKYNVNDQHPEIVREIQKAYEEHINSFTPAPSIMEGIIGE